MFDKNSTLHAIENCVISYSIQEAPAEVTAHFRISLPFNYCVYSVSERWHLEGAQCISDVSEILCSQFECKMSTQCLQHCQYMRHVFTSPEYSHFPLSENIRVLRIIEYSEMELLNIFYATSQKQRRSGLLTNSMENSDLWENIQKFLSYFKIPIILLTRRFSTVFLGDHHWSLP